MLYLFTLLFLSGNILNICDPIRNEEETPVFVAIIFNHGAVSPIFQIPKDNESYWKNGTGQLTWRGKKESYELGLTLRDLYVGEGKLLSNDIKNNEVHSRSTGYDMAIMTMELVLAAMFPPDTPQDWNPSLKWQPISFHSVNPENDPLLLGFLNNSCPRINEIKEQMYQYKEYDDLQKMFDKFLSELSNSIGLSLDLHKAADLYGSLYCEKYEGLKLPDVYDYNVVNTLENLFIDYWRFHYNSILTELMRISSGVLWSKILDYVRDISYIITEPNVVYEDYTKMLLLSAHDSTIINFLNLLGFGNERWPIFNSHLRLEIYNISKTAYMKIIYNVESESKVLRYFFCLGKDKCEVSAIFNYLGSQRSIDREEECRAREIPPQTTSTTTYSPYTSTTSSPTPIPDPYRTQRIAMWMIIITSLLVLSGLIIYVMRNRNRRVGLGYAAIE